MRKKSFFISTCTFVMFLLAAVCVSATLILSANEGKPLYSDFFGIGMAIWYLLVGVGLLSRSMWGYCLLKAFLFILALGFPIGTLISYYSLKYMKNNDIKDLFKTTDEVIVGQEHQ